MSKIKFLPKKILQDLDLNQTYPKSLRHGNKAVKSFFDDSKTVVFNSDDEISLPTTSTKHFLNKLGEFGFTTNIYVNGKTNQEAASQVINLTNNQKSFVEPFIEDNIPDSYFYESGTTFLTTHIKDKDVIKIKLPIPKNESFSGDNDRIEYLTLSPGLLYDGINENAGWVKSEILLSNTDKTLNLQKAITDPLGNLVNHNFINGGVSYNNFIENIHSQSFIRNNVDDNLKIKLSDYINKPFVVEKISISFYGQPSLSWLSSKTQLEYVSINEKPNLVGSSITAILAATNNGYYKTFFSGTIVSKYDTHIEQTNLQLGESSELESFPIGFDLWSTPTSLLSNSSLTKIILEGPATFSNGAIQYFRTNSYNEFKSLQDGNIWSAKKIGRSNLGFNSGYSKFANEYSLPNSLLTSNMINYNEEITFYNHVFNNYKSYESPCVLMPSDNLVFTLSKFINSQTQLISGSFILGGNEMEPIESEYGYEYKDLDQTNYITINLYGSYLKENKEIHDLYSQNTITNCVHEIIGDDIITDNFECYPADSLSGSIINNSKIYKSDIIGEFLEAGFSFNNINYLNSNRINSYEKNPDTILNNKKLCQIIVNGSGEMMGHPTIYDFYQGSILSSSFNELKNKMLYTQTYDNNEYIYDSLTPSISHILATQNNKIINFKRHTVGLQSLYDGILLISNSHISDSLSTIFGPDKQYAFLDWQSKFPFDDEFSNCNRIFKEKIVLSSDRINFSTDLLSTSSFHTEATKRIVNTDLNILISIINDSADLESIPTYGDFVVIKNNTIEHKFWSGLKYEDYKKVMFGSTRNCGLNDKPYGKSNTAMPVYSSEDYTHYFNSSNEPFYPTDSTAHFTSLQVYVSPIIRGWKYGLYSGIETQNKMHWSAKHYGHFRDLIEQRLFTTFYYVSGKDNGVSTPVITIYFVNPLTGKSIDPELTDSSNLNYDASSVRPYFDGIAKNRTYII